MLSICLFGGFLIICWCHFVFLVFFSSLSFYHLILSIYLSLSILSSQSTILPSSSANQLHLMLELFSFFFSFCYMLYICFISSQFCFFGNFLFYQVSLLSTSNSAFFYGKLLLAFFFSLSLLSFHFTFFLSLCISLYFALFFLVPFYFFLFTSFFLYI